ncbi:hypothetical protein [Thiolinea disciformis]|uniref:hypothetical protein n=1 Tax=Thiolinea disciformis TaxID=125614 RepID=UPI00036FE008|nr:hypothetical protein [Thiolinea disciformis]
MTLAYKVTAGSYVATNQIKDNDRLLLSLTTELGMDGLGGFCQFELSGANFKPLAIGESVKVELNTGQGMHTVFTGQVTDMEISAGTQKILALDAISRLASKQLAIVYEKVKLHFIIKDLISQADLECGEICQGAEVQSYLIHPHQPLLSHLTKLAECCGADLYCKGDGKIYVTTPTQRGTEHHFEFGRQIRALQVIEQRLPFDSIELWGEGAGGTQGAEKAHWLSADISSISSKVSLDQQGNVRSGSLGKQVRRVYDGALRTQEAVEQSALARMTWLASRRIGGKISVHGTASVMPADLVVLDKIPKDHSVTPLLKENNHPLRVRCVRHELSRQTGLVTHLTC